MHRKAVRIGIENQLREWERSTNEQRGEERQLRVSPEELHRVAKKAVIPLKIHESYFLLDS